MAGNFFQVATAKILTGCLRPLADGSEGNHRGLLTREEHLGLAKDIFDSCQSERDIKERLKGFLEDLSEELIARSWPEIASRNSHADRIVAFNQLVDNFSTAVSFLSKFFRFHDLPGTQRNLFLTGTLAERMDHVFAEVIVQAHLSPLIESFRLRMQIDPFSADFSALGTFLRHIFRFAKLKNEPKVVEIILEIIKVTFDCKITESLQDIHRGSTDRFFVGISRLKTTADKFAQDLFAGDQFAVFRAQLQILSSKKMSSCVLPLLRAQNWVLFLKMISEGGQGEDLGAVWHVVGSPEVVLEDFKQVYLDFIVDHGMSILEKETQEKKRVDALLAFLVTVSKTSELHFENNKWLRFARNKAFEEIMTGRHFGARGLSQEDFLDHLLGWIAGVFEAECRTDALTETALDLLAYVNPKVLKGTLVPFFLTTALRNFDSTALSKRKNFLELIAGKLGEESVAPAIHVMREGRLSSQVSQGPTEVTVFLAPEKDNFCALEVVPSPEFDCLIPAIQAESKKIMAENMTEVAVDFENGTCEVEMEWRGKRALLVSTPLTILVLTFLGNRNRASATEIGNAILKNAASPSSLPHLRLLEILEYLVSEGVASQNEDWYALADGIVSRSPRILLNRRGLEKPRRTDEKRESKLRNSKIESVICRIIKKVDGVSVQELKMLVRAHLGSDLEDDTLLAAVASLIENDYISLSEGGTFHFGAGESG